MHLKTRAGQPKIKAPPMAYQFQGMLRASFKTATHLAQGQNGPARRANRPRQGWRGRSAWMRFVFAIGLARSGPGTQPTATINPTHSSTLIHKKEEILSNKKRINKSMR